MSLLSEYGKQAALIKMGLKEYAPGIPTSKSIDPLPEIKSPQNWTFALQRHIADRAKEHLDLRLVDGSTGKAHSWAIPRGELPKPGKSVRAIQQPTHTADYALNFGKKGPQTIEKGYGKGTVTLERVEPTDVYHMTDSTTPGTRVRFNLYPGTGPEEYALVRSTGDAEYLVNKTLSRERVPHLDIGSKPKLKEIKFREADTSHEDEVFMPKLDGGHVLLDLPKGGKIPRLFSYREPTRATSGVIEHTHKVPLLLKLRVPADLEKTTLRAEAIAVDATGKAIPAKNIAGMLNATVANSRAKQKELNANLLPVVFDVTRYQGKDVQGLPFPARYEILKSITSRMPLPLIEIATTKLEKDRLLRQIEGRKHPLTTEGVVIQKTTGTGVATKAKIRPTHDVYVREIFGATNAKGEKLDRAGGFEYSWTPQGPIAGRVGTGFNHEELRAMLRNPKEYTGRVAEVEAETKFESGALSKASFTRWHMEKGKQT